MAAYQEALVNQDQQVRVLEPGHEYTGVARGINAMGELLVEKEDGTITEVYAGEVSVRGALRICIGGKMYADRIVLCGASAYEQKYYLIRILTPCHSR